MLIEIVIFVGVNCGVGGGDVGYVSSLSLSSIFVALKGGEGEKGNIWTNKPEKICT